VTITKVSFVLVKKEIYCQFIRGLRANKTLQLGYLTKKRQKLIFIEGM